jgi:DNA-binding MarR family transcriptional regulator
VGEHALALQITTGVRCGSPYRHRGRMNPRYTAKQGQYLAFIYYFTKVNGRAPAEADMQHYFGTTPPSVHQMVLTLERNQLIARTPGAARSIRVLLDRASLPDLE